MRNWGSWSYQEDNETANPTFLEKRDLANFVTDEKTRSASRKLAVGEAAAEAFANDEMTPEEFDIAVGPTRKPPETIFRRFKLN